MGWTKKAETGVSALILFLKKGLSRWKGQERIFRKDGTY